MTSDVKEGWTVPCLKLGPRAKNLVLSQFGIVSFRTQVVFYLYSQQNLFFFLVHKACKAGRA